MSRRAPNQERCAMYPPTHHNSSGKNGFRVQGSGFRVQGVLLAENIAIQANFADFRETERDGISDVGRGARPALARGSSRENLCAGCAAGRRTLPSGGRARRGGGRGAPTMASRPTGLASLHDHRTGRARLPPSRTRVSSTTNAQQPTLNVQGEDTASATRNSVGRWLLDVER